MENKYQFSKILIKKTKFSHVLPQFKYKRMKLKKINLIKNPFKEAKFNKD
jgi:hypothetical protein